MFRKEEKKSLTRLALLSIGWGLGLDRFYEGRIKDGFLSLIGWGSIFISLIALSPCHSSDYTDSAKGMADISPDPIIFIPLALAIYGSVLVVRKGFRLLRQFESAED